MSTDATGYILVIMALGMSILAFKMRLVLATLGAIALWGAFLSFAVSNLTAMPMTEQIVIAIGAVVAALFFYSLFGRLPGEASNGDEGTFKRMVRRMNGESVSRPRSRGETPEEYQARVHKSLHPRLRR